MGFYFRKKKRLDIWWVRYTILDADLALLGMLGWVRWGIWPYWAVMGIGFGCSGCFELD